MPSHLEGEDHDDHHGHVGNDHGSVEAHQLAHNLAQRGLDPDQQNILSGKKNFLEIFDKR